MKKLTNCVSPFIMLLFPLFLLVGFLAMNVNKEIPAERQKASISFQVPSLKGLIQAAVK